MWVALSVEIDSRIVLGGCLVNDKYNDEVSVVFCIYLLYEYLNGWTYMPHLVW